MTARAKFVCEKKLRTSGEPEEGYEILLRAVSATDGENADFFRYTPAAEIRLATVKPAAADQFEVGKDYYVAFTPADKKAAVHRHRTARTGP